MYWKYKEKGEKKKKKKKKLDGVNQYNNEKWEERRNRSDTFLREPNCLIIQEHTNQKEEHTEIYSY